MVVSRWLVIPMAAIWSARTRASSNAVVIWDPTDDKIAFGSCSTQPGLG
jgi:hypothetical protein